MPSEHRMPAGCGRDQRRSRPVHRDLPGRLAFQSSVRGELEIPETSQRRCAEQKHRCNEDHSILQTLRLSRLTFRGRSHRSSFWSISLWNRCETLMCGDQPIPIGYQYSTRWNDSQVLVDWRTKHPAVLRSAVTDRVRIYSSPYLHAPNRRRPTSPECVQSRGRDRSVLL